MEVDIEKENDDLYLTEFGIPIRNIWHMLLYAWDNPPIERIGKLSNIEEAPTLDSLFANILLSLLQQRLRIGLSRNYLKENHLIKGIRGKIDFSNSIKNQTFEKNHAFCDFDVFTQNVPKNQIIKTTIFKLIQTGKFGVNKTKASNLSHSLRLIFRSLNEVDIIEIRPDHFKTQQIGRNDRDYKMMLSLCELIYLHKMPIDSGNNKQLPDLMRKTLVMHEIYEKFIANFYCMNLAGWVVEPQKKFEWFDEYSNNYLPIMKPDLVFTNKVNGNIVILDTKFTARSLIPNQWGKNIFNQSNLYQIYSYLKTQEHTSKAYMQAEGILLYPTIDSHPISEKILLPGHTIRIETIDLAKEWQHIEIDLLKMLEQ
jgi:5-methylcytosine-specific restriction enzyme subunit McrC